MGMFDYVKYEANCQNCGSSLNDFQTKEGVCELETLEPCQVDNFYTSCDACKTWHEFHVNRTCIVNSIKVETQGG